MYFCQVAGPGNCLPTYITFHVLHYGSISSISSEKKLIHLLLCCKTSMQTHCGSRTALATALLVFRLQASLILRQL